MRRAVSSVTLCRCYSSITSMANYFNWEWQNYSDCIKTSGSSRNHLLHCWIANPLAPNISFSRWLSWLSWLATLHYLLLYPSCVLCSPVRHVHRDPHLRIEAYLRPATRQSPVRFVSLADLTVDVSRYASLRDDSGQAGSQWAAMGGEMGANSRTSERQTTPT